MKIHEFIWCQSLELMAVIILMPHGFLVSFSVLPKNTKSRFQFLKMFRFLILGFHQNREFIITQHPLKETIMEFWQMLWNHNAQTVVMLTQCDEVKIISETTKLHFFTVWKF